MPLLSHKVLSMFCSTSILILCITLHIEVHIFQLLVSICSDGSWCLEAILFFFNFISGISVRTFSSFESGSTQSLEIISLMKETLACKFAFVFIKLQIFFYISEVLCHGLCHHHPNILQVKRHQQCQIPLAVLSVSHLSSSGTCLLPGQLQIATLYICIC